MSPPFYKVVHEEHYKDVDEWLQDELNTEKTKLSFRVSGWRERT